VQPRTCSRPERGNVPRLAPGAQDAWRLFVYAASSTRPFWSLAASTDGVVSAGTRNVPCPRAVVSPLAFVRPRNLFTPARPPRQGRGRGSCSLQAAGPVQPATGPCALVTATLPPPAAPSTANPAASSGPLVSRPQPACQPRPPALAGPPRKCSLRRPEPLSWAHRRLPGNAGLTRSPLLRKPAALVRSYRMTPPLGSKSEPGAFAPSRA
jgi:hypothetical protein